MSEIMKRIQIDLSKSVLDELQSLAGAVGRSRKNFIEFELWKLSQKQKKLPLESLSNDNFENYQDTE